MRVDQETKKPRDSGLSFGAIDAITAVVVFVLGLVMMVDNHRIGSSWAADGPESGYFPYYIGLILCLAGAGVAVMSLFGKRRNRLVFVTWDRFRQVLMVLLPTIVYVLVIQFAGIYVASTFFIAAFMRILGRIGWLKTVLVSVGVNALLFWMFEIQFMVPLPKGPMEVMLGY